MGHQLCFLTVLRTLKLYFRHPAEAIRIERREWGKYLAQRNLQKRGLAAIYDDLPSGAYEPDWADLLNIYELVRRRKPQVVIEFGSGCSTPMFAQALADNERDDPSCSGHLYSIETSRFFRDQTENYIPKHLQSYVDVLYSDFEVVDDDQGNRVLIHSEVPDVAPNLVYLDGPNLPADCKVGADGVFLEKKAGDDFAILIDGRGPTFRYTEANLKRSYKVSQSDTHKWELLEAAP